MAREMTLPGPMTPARKPARLAPTKGWPKPARKSMPFSGLMAFTFVLFVAPQNLIPALEPLMLAKLAVAFAGIGYLVNRAVTGAPLTVMTAPVKWVLVLAVIGVLSIPAGYWPGGSVNVYTELFGKSIAIFILIANVVDTQERFRIFVGSMIGWGAFTAINAVGNYLTGRLDPTGQRIAGYESPLAVNPNDLALTMNILIGLAIGLLPVLRSRGKRLLLIAGMGIMVAGVIVSFSRSGFVTLGVVGAFWAARRLRERGGRALPSIALVVLVVVLAVPAGYSDRLATIVHTEADTTGSADERWQTMMTAVHLIAERPVLGYGLGNNLHVSVDRGGLSREAHNAYLKLGAELGVAALVVYVLFLFSSIGAARAVRKFFRAREDGWELGRLAGGVELALIAFAVGAFFSPVPYHFYAYYPAGLAVAIFAIAARVPASPARRRAD
ncbi:MAG: O-antigen ligase family protein [Candidatus Rokubacteria bacterium]|nr:O-antigen ligase family protein [Candidatus Rokubacteria bacterium]